MIGSGWINHFNDNGEVIRKETYSKDKLVKIE